MLVEQATAARDGTIVTLDEAQNLPRRIVQDVRRTAESVVLADAQCDER